MENLYVFAIGGSGERVMYSFLMELVSGMKINAAQVVPVFVDNDEKSEALIRCTNLLKAYNDESDNIGANTLYQKYLGTNETWPSFFQTKIAKPETLNLSGSTLGNLDEVIGRLDRENVIEKDIIEEKELLFSRDDLEMPLNVGFVGNPNIGSIVLNSKSLQEGFNTICAKAGSNDGVIVIGSLFGGTGAAGIPLIIHRFEQKEGEKPLLGAISVLPYFDTDKNNRQDQGSKQIIDTDKYDVDSDSFDARTRAALMYYEDNLSDVNYQYYVGCNDKALYNHCVGSELQKNPVHLVEVMSGLCIFDFAQRTKKNETVYCRPTWIVADNNDSNLSGITFEEFKKSAVKFQMFKKILQEDGFLKGVKGAIEQKRKYVSDINFAESYRSMLFVNPDKFTTGIYTLFNMWNDWLTQLTDAEKFKFKLADLRAVVNDENSLLESFYTTRGDNDKGIIMTKKHIIFGHESKEIVKPQIDHNLLKAYDSLYPHGNEASKYDEPKSIATLFRVISAGLDKVIENNCKL